MFKFSSVIVLALLLTGCSGSAKNPEATRGETSPQPPRVASCEDDRLSTQLERLHSLALADDELPARVHTQYEAALDGLRVPNTTEDGAFSVATQAVPLDIVPIVHHAPRFQGEEKPRIIHWEQTGVGQPSDHAFADDLSEVADGTDSVILALWRGMEASELDQLLGVLKQTGVQTVSLLGRQELPPLGSLEPPASAAKLYEKMQENHARTVAARARATHELERLVLDASGDDNAIPARISDPGQSLEQRSRAYIDFLRSAYYRSDCTVDANHLVWLYRTRFAPAPLAVIELDLASYTSPEGAATLQEFAARAASRP